MSEPYYQDEHVTLWHGDCRDHSEWARADVLVTDPPYGISYRSNRRRARLARSIHGDQDTSLRDWVLREWSTTCPACGGSGSPQSPSAAMFLGECVTCAGKGRVPDSGRPALVFGTWRMPRPHGTHTRLIWDTKGALGMGNLSVPWKPSDQEIYVIGHGFTGRRTSNVLSYAPVQSMARNGREHPHQKPIALMRDLIAKCPVGAIADPFAGSGSTLVAAKALGCKAIGVELDERYCEVIAKRLAQGVLDFAEGAEP